MNAKVEAFLLIINSLLSPCSRCLNAAKITVGENFSQCADIAPVYSCHNLSVGSIIPRLYRGLF
jgi:hypothetical protein